MTYNDNFCYYAAGYDFTPPVEVSTKYEFLESNKLKFITIKINDYYDGFQITTMMTNGTDDKILINEDGVSEERLMNIVYEMTNLVYFEFTSRFIGEYDHGFLDKPLPDSVKYVTVNNKNVATNQFINKATVEYTDFEEEDECLLKPITF